MKKALKVLSLILAINIFANSQSTLFPVGETMAISQFGEPQGKIQLLKNLFGKAQPLLSNAKNSIQNIYSTYAPGLGESIKVNAVEIGKHVCDHPALLYGALAAGTSISLLIYYRNAIANGTIAAAKTPFKGLSWTGKKTFQLTSAATKGTLNFANRKKNEAITEVTKILKYSGTLAKNHPYYDIMIAGAVLLYICPELTKESVSKMIGFAMEHKKPAAVIWAFVDFILLGRNCTPKCLWKKFRNQDELERLKEKVRKLESAPHFRIAHQR